MKRFCLMLSLLSAIALAGVAIAQTPTTVPPAKTAPTQVTAPVRPVPPSFADIVQNLSPAVVNISTTQKVKRRMMPGLMLPPGSEFDEFREFFEQFGGMSPRGNGLGGRATEQEVYSLGSGFLIDPSGLVVTNYHVIADAEKIKVILSDDTTLDATLVGRDSKTDLALLRVVSKKPLPFVKFGNSDTARVGDWVLAIGNPFGLGGTVTAGIISARARNINAGPFDDFIQTDAAINRGNSGGPLFNLNGEVIAINSAIFSPTGGNIGIGFAVPSNLARPVLEQLKSRGHIERGWLGVKIQEVNDEIANSLGLPKEAGALVLEVTRGSPAEKAGIKPGDIITGFDGKDISQMRSLPRIVAETPIGKKVALTVWRNGKNSQVTAVIVALKDEDNDAASPPKKPKARESAFSMVGMGVADLTDALREQAGLEASARGVMVVELSDDGEAARRGLRYGDVIDQVNGTKVSDISQFSTAIRQAKEGKRHFVLLRILREDAEFFVTLPIS